MIEIKEIDLILEAMAREGLILALPDDQYKMTELGMIKASQIIAQDYELQMKLGGFEAKDEHTQKVILEEFANSIANSRSGVLGYMVRYYKGLNAKA